MLFPFVCIHLIILKTKFRFEGDGKGEGRGLTFPSLPLDPSLQLLWFVTQTTNPHSVSRFRSSKVIVTVIVNKTELLFERLQPVKIRFWLFKVIPKIVDTAPLTEITASGHTIFS